MDIAKSVRSMPWFNSIQMSFGDEEYLLLREFIRLRIGLDFAPPRREILASRLRRRVEALSLRSYLEYYQYLLYSVREARDRELEELTEALANHETYFYRESYQLDLLYHSLWAELKYKKPIRILSAGCSTGEEVYSLQINAHENNIHESDVSVVGVELCRSAVNTAKTGLYRPYSFRFALPFAKERYFTPAAEGCWVVKPSLQERVNFYQGNLVDSFSVEALGLFDVIFCRNVLIYFDDAMLTRVAKSFWKLLRPKGYLFLGHSETLLGRGLPFEAVRIGQYIVYRKVGP
jgi:chemotaxis protein methyltransferase CheR